MRTRFTGTKGAETSVVKLPQSVHLLTLVARRTARWLNSAWMLVYSLSASSSSSLKRTDIARVFAALQTRIQSTTPKTPVERNIADVALWTGAIHYMSPFEGGGSAGVGLQVRLLHTHI